MKSAIEAIVFDCEAQTLQSQAAAYRKIRDLVRDQRPVTGPTFMLPPEPPCLPVSPELDAWVANDTPESAAAPTGAPAAAQEPQAQQEAPAQAVPATPKGRRPATIAPRGHRAQATTSQPATPQTATQQSPEEDLF